MSSDVLAKQDKRLFVATGMSRHTHSGYTPDMHTLWVLRHDSFLWLSPRLVRGCQSLNVFYCRSELWHGVLAWIKRNITLYWRTGFKLGKWRAWCRSALGLRDDDHAGHGERQACLYM